MMMTCGGGGGAAGGQRCVMTTAKRGRTRGSERGQYHARDPVTHARSRTLAHALHAHAEQPLQPPLLQAPYPPSAPYGASSCHA